MSLWKWAIWYSKKSFRRQICKSISLSTLFLKWFSKFFWQPKNKRGCFSNKPNSKEIYNFLPSTWLDIKNAVNGIKFENSKMVFSTLIHIFRFDIKDHNSWSHYRWQCVFVFRLKNLGQNILSKFKISTLLSNRIKDFLWKKLSHLMTWNTDRQKQARLFEQIVLLFMFSNAK